MESKKVKVTFGLQEHQIERINKERARWNQPDSSIPGTPPDAILIEGFWDQLGDNRVSSAQLYELFKQQKEK